MKTRKLKSTDTACNSCKTFQKLLTKMEKSIQVAEKTQKFLESKIEALEDKLEALQAGIIIKNETDLETMNEMKTKMLCLELQVAEVTEATKLKPQGTQIKSVENDDLDGDYAWHVKHGKRPRGENGDALKIKTSRAADATGTQAAEAAGVDTLIIGSSQVDRVGMHIGRQHNRFRAVTLRGAKIEDVAKVIRDTKRAESTENIVVMASTNNITCNGTEEMLRKYKSLIDAAKGRSYKRVVMVGMLTRCDIGPFFESKRLAVNLQLKKMCAENEVEFLDVDFYKDREMYLWKDLLHLNDAGADLVGRLIYKKIGHKTLNHLN